MNWIQQHQAYLCMALGNPILTRNSANMSVQMIKVIWTSDHGWHAPEIVPYGPLTMMPTASCLHYATSCFEGMKVYRGFDGKLRLFRPDRNCGRLVTSSSRLALPAFDPAELEKLLKAFLGLDGPRKYLSLSALRVFG